MPISKEILHGEQVFLLHNFLSPQECAAHIARSEQSGYEEATITTSRGAVMEKSIRDNSRLIVDDHALASEWLERAKAFLPPNFGGAKLRDFNERFRYYRYDVGQKFAMHYDGYYRRENGEQSQLTFMVYLNADFSGGDTRFYLDPRVPHLIVRPVAGTALVFVHRQLHEGAPVHEGRKYVLRTDVMYCVPAAT